MSRNAVRAGRSLFGPVIVLLFILVQAFDGAFTYFGILTFGPGAEGNPLIASLVGEFGDWAGLVSAKVFASVLGVVLHIISVTRIVAALTCFHLAVAVVPWALTF